LYTCLNCIVLDVRLALINRIFYTVLKSISAEIKEKNELLKTNKIVAMKSLLFNFLLLYSLLFYPNFVKLSLTDIYTRFYSHKL